ncbi:MAG TPA: FAD:protein FMN transferase [Acidiferrobacterales bacterium]
MRCCLILLLAAVATACQPPEPVRHREARALMGTLVEVTAEGADPVMLAAAGDAAYREMGRLSDMMNHYDPGSVVSAINRAAGVRPVAVPPELMQVLQRATEISERSGGAFDITVGALRGWRFDPDRPEMPDRRAIAGMLERVDYRRLELDVAAGTAFLARAGMRIDLGGIAKLYILDAGIGVLERHGVDRAMINGGGDVVVTGGAPKRPWRVGIRDPRQPERLFGVVEIERGYVVSSGDYERFFIKDGRRYHHILDPRTGYPTEGPRGVTLVSESLDRVNGLSAAIMVLGAERGRALIEADPAVEGVIFGRDGSTWVSPALQPRLVAPEDATE